MPDRRDMGRGDRPGCTRARAPRPAVRAVPAAMIIALALAAALLGGCGDGRPAGQSDGRPDGPGAAVSELPAADSSAVASPVPAEPRLLPLAGPIASPDAEISALCWCGDNLVIVPQHPERFGARPGELGLFTVTRQEILDVLDHRRREPLEPRPLVLEAPDLIESLPGWDGLEAVASAGDTIYFAVETELEGRMGGVLLRGTLAPADQPLRLRVDTARMATVPLPTDLPEMSQEALVLAPGRVAVLFEANGLLVNPGAHAALFDAELEYRGTAPLEHVEYRITDATAADAAGRFWVINYFFPGEARLLRPPTVPDQPVEQLLELRLHRGRITHTDRAPLDLRRDPDQPARNWEALARLPGRGFLLMTDRYPATMLAFVPDPELDREP